MTKFQWKNRREYIRKTAFSMYLTFEKTQKFIKENDMSGGVSLDVVGHLDYHLDEFSYNPDWISRNTLDDAWKQIKDSIFELARNDNQELCDWIKKNYKKSYQDFLDEVACG